MGKEPEKTVATLDLGQNCLLTLTTRHLRGQVMRMMADPGQPPRLIKDQIDVLLSGLSGYSVEENNMKVARIVTRVIGVLFALAGIGILCSGLGFISFLGWIFMIVGIIQAVVAQWFPADKATFTINAMGSKVAIPVAFKQVEVCRGFITKLQQAKTEYEEATA